VLGACSVSAGPCALSSQVLSCSAHPHDLSLARPHTVVLFSPLLPHNDSDNLGATLDLKLLSYFASSGKAFMMEVCVCVCLCVTHTDS
jgi:hypothetical protein